GLDSGCALTLIDDDANHIAVHPDVMENVATFSFVLDQIRPELPPQARGKFFFEFETFSLRRRSSLHLLQPLLQDPNHSIFSCQEPLGSSAFESYPFLSRSPCLRDRLLHPSFTIGHFAIVMVLAL